MHPGQPIGAHRKNIFIGDGGQTLAQVAQGGCGLFGDIQNLCGQISEQPAVSWPCFEQ